MSVSRIAIVGLQVLCAAGAAVAVGVALGWWRWPRLGRWVAAGAVVLAAAVAVFVLAADPIDHLNNRWSGWLGASSTGGPTTPTTTKGRRGRGAPSKCLRRGPAP